MKVKHLNIVVCGCQKLAVDVIDFIYGQGPIRRSDCVVFPKITGVFTYDKPHDKLFGNKTVEEFCNSLNIPNERIEKLTVQDIAKYKPDIIFSVYYRRIFSKDVIDAVPMGIINIHPAALPKYRGCDPTRWAIINKETTTASTLHYVDEGIDTGDIIAQKRLDVGSRTAFELNRDMMILGLDLFKSNFIDIMMSKVNRVKQNHNVATCCVKFREQFRYINWMSPADNVIAHIKAFAPPYVGAIAHNPETQIIVEKAEILNIERCGGPGEYVVQDGGIVVQTFDRPIKITKYSGVLPDKGKFIAGVL